MKKIVGVILFLLVSSVCLANSDPVVSGISVSQRTDGSKLMDIRYNLSDADGDKCTVSVQVSNDGGSTWTVHAVSFNAGSSIGKNISPGNGKLIVWDAGKDLPGVSWDNCMIKITANDTSRLFNFINITESNAVNVQIGEDQLAVEVSDNGSSRVLFNFTNSGPLSSSITQIYLEDTLNLFTGVYSLIESSGVDFVNDITPGSLLGGNLISFVADYEVKAVSPVTNNGVGPGESLGVVFNLSDGFTYNGLINSLNEGTTRIGIHVGGFPTLTSEAFVNSQSR